MQFKFIALSAAVSAMPQAHDHTEPKGATTPTKTVNTVATGTVEHDHSTHVHETGVPASTNSAVSHSSYALLSLVIANAI
jgi:hypothetical protein